MGEMRPTTESIAPDEYRRLAEVRYQIRRYVSFSERAARAAGLEPRQYQLMLMVKGLPDGQQPTIGVLADRLKIQHHSAVELVNRLVDRGLVARRRGESDRRQVFVSLTDEGERMIQSLVSSHLEEMRSVGPELVRALNVVLAREAGSNGER